MNNRKTLLRMALMLLFVTLFAKSGNAHVQLNSPNGGEVFQAGDTVTVEWQVVIQHATEDWDLSYSVSGDAGPWIDIAENIAVGNPNPGAIHTYQWIVPDNPSIEVRVRIIQDNLNNDYIDFSQSDITIQSPPPSCCVNARGNANSDPGDNTNVADITFLVDYLFGVPSGSAPECDQEANANGDPGESVNISDITYLIAYLFGIPSGSPPPACP